jgi:molybdopterin/thiamine biosynthesis adenylyltransferase
MSVSTKHFERIHQLEYIGPSGLERLQSKTVAIFGLGNVGSQVALHLGLLGIQMILVDRGKVEEVNLATQAYRVDDIGMPKVEALRTRLNATNPACQIQPIFADFRQLGAAAIEADLYLSCLDSLTDRILLNERAFITRTMWLDGALDGTGRARYGRVSVFDPALSDSPCYLCPWDSKGLQSALYQERERTGSTGGLRRGCANWKLQWEADSPPTLASSSLGGLVAGVQSMLAIELLLDNTGRSLAGVELVSDFTRAPYSSREYRLKRNRRCLSAHPVFESLHSANRETCVAGLLDRAETALSAPATLRIRGRELVLRLRCPACRSEQAIGRIVEGIQEEEARCQCGRAMIASGHDLLNRFNREQAKPFLDRSFLELGVPAMDLVSASGGVSELHFLMT